MTTDTSTQPCMPLPLTTRSSVVYNWTYGTLGITSNDSHSLAWSRPCSDRGEIEPTSVVHASTDNRYLTYFVQIGRHMGEYRPKNLFITSKTRQHSVRGDFVRLAFCRWAAVSDCLFCRGSFSITIMCNSRGYGFTIEHISPFVLRITKFEPFK